jgi:hypothetical protein
MSVSVLRPAVQSIHRQYVVDSSEVILTEMAEGLQRLMNLSVMTLMTMKAAILVYWMMQWVVVEDLAAPMRAKTMTTSGKGWTRNLNEKAWLFE